MPRRTAKELFLDALDLDEAARAGFLDAACGGDGSLRAQVLSLLAAHEDAGAFMAGDAPVASSEETTAPNTLGARAGVNDDVSPGDRIGEYAFIRSLGEGGFGTVYLAEQTEPILRQVAATAARFVDPHSTEDMARGIVDIVTDRSLRERLAAAGRARAARFPVTTVARRWRELHEALLR